MKWRVIDLENAVELECPENYEYLLHDDGSVSCVSDYDTDSFSVPVPYIVEFAFRKDEENQWVWEHSVIQEK